MASLLTALPAASKHTPRSPVNLSARVGDDTPASLMALADHKSLAMETSHTQNHITTLATASSYTPKTAALVVVVAAHLQPT